MTMSAWRVAKSLVTLRDQVNAAHPRRDKSSDGTIGDAAHAATISDHNPDVFGVVRALDLDHDPEGKTYADKLDAHALADVLVASRDPRIKYVISRGRIARSYPKGDVKPYTWAKYTGTDPHTSHVHVSVVASSLADSTRPWVISAKKWSPPKFPGVVKLGDRSGAVKTWQGALNRWAKAHKAPTVTVDGAFGPRTLSLVLRAQRAYPWLAKDGIAGPATWTALNR